MVNEKFLKPYDPKTVEPKIYDAWEQSGFFNPDVCVDKGVTKPDAEPFTIVLPPPNVTGTLHLGHALEDSLQDAFIRFARMRGYKTLWVPGTDHAAIATQTKVEKLVEKEGLRRTEMGREAFLERVQKFAQESHDTIVSQVKRMGASLDWSREAFTLDEKRNFAVRTTFKKMYDAGLIYQGERIVNWDPKGQTVISDDEIEYAEEKTTFYYFTYGPFEIGTARPETKFGDKYVVMHPDDTRYKKYRHGEKIELEWINGPITATIIKDPVIDMEFGTGVMTITPWHSMVDFDIATRHNLDREQIIDQFGRLLPIAGEFAGQKITEAREKIVEKLRAKGLVSRVEENYVHNVATAQRSGGKIEPQIMKQWFVDVNKSFTPPGTLEPMTLKEWMRIVVADKHIDILPDRFEKVYFHWIDNLRDWCISRQIWYGHRIPVWYRSTGAHGKQNTEVYVGIEAPADEGWEQDPDTLDTWFSSALWTFSTLGWPEDTLDFRTFHPTTVMAPGYEILFFWVARMILMSGFLLGTIPFKTVYLHGILRDEKGKKFSKSLGNGVDPIEISNEYGADALRMSLIVGIGPGNDSNFSLDKVRAYKKFSNKLWNITRFILENGEGTPEEQPELRAEDSARIEELSALTKEVTADFEKYRLYLAGEKLYHYVWHTLADVILEERKAVLVGDDASAKASAQWTLMYMLQTSLKLLHPLMPFITEEIWQSLPNRERDMLMVSSWPTL
jgi:valyl-tRNA synthetase